MWSAPREGGRSVKIVQGRNHKTWITNVTKIADWRPDFPDRPWLLLGKGPTFDKFFRLNRDDWNIIAINESANLVDSPEIVVCNDTEAIRSLVCNGLWLVTPEKPHINGIPEDPEKILHGLQHVTFRKPEDIQAFASSSESAIGVLSHLGVSKVSTLGIDGGKYYSNRFKSKPDSKGYQIHLDKFQKQASKYKITVKQAS